MTVVKKVLIGVTVLAAVILILLWILGTNEARIMQWKLDREQAAYDALVEQEINKYKNDFDGGKTPEETIELLLTALKEGDIKRASSYYELSVQGEALKSLQDELEKRGNLNQSIDYTTQVYKDGVKKCNEEGDGCTFEFDFVRTEASTSTVVISGQPIVLVSPAGSMGRKIIDISLNQFTNVWKIKFPY